jgi:hypothetical protein
MTYWRITTTPTSVAFTWVPDAPGVFRWLCQLRVPPYRLRLDPTTFGRQASTPAHAGACEELMIGQPVMRFFDLVSYSSAIIT